MTSRADRHAAFEKRLAYYKQCIADLAEKRLDRELAKARESAYQTVRLHTPVQQRWEVDMAYRQMKEAA